MKKSILFFIVIAGFAFFAPAASGQSDQRPEDTKKQEWTRNLGRALALEKFAMEQYTADSEKLNISMPYRTIIPQVEDHIQTLSELGSQFGIEGGEPKHAVPSGSIPQAYRLGIKTSQHLATLYEWLVRNTEDRNAAALINDLLIQTRRHLALFDHGLKAGRGMGAGTGPSWMNR